MYIFRAITFPIHPVLQCTNPGYRWTIVWKGSGSGPKVVVGELGQIFINLEWQKVDEDGYDLWKGSNKVRMIEIQHWVDNGQESTETLENHSDSPAHFGSAEHVDKIRGWPVSQQQENQKVQPAMESEQWVNQPSDFRFKVKLLSPP